MDARTVGNFPAEQADLKNAPNVGRKTYTGILKTHATMGKVKENAEERITATAQKAIAQRATARSSSLLFIYGNHIFYAYLT